MSGRRLAWLVSLFAAPLLVFGCGGGGDAAGVDASYPGDTAAVVTDTTGDVATVDGAAADTSGPVDTAGGVDADPAPGIDAPAIEDIPGLQDDVSAPSQDTSPAADASGHATDVGTDTVEVTPDPTLDVEVPDPCGDGVCIGDEGPGSCPVDCGDPATGSALCLVGSCPGEMQICQADPGCNGVYLCLLACEDEACAEGCYVDVPGPSVAWMVEALGCAQDAGCFGGDTACGDGVCADDEDGFTCPVDCGMAPDCVEAACGPEVTACLEDPACQALRDCAAGCKSEGCEDACYLASDPLAIAAMVALTTCAEAADCVAPEHVCGDGFCEAGEDPGTCPGDCSSTCGDGACDPGETEESCPQDCATATCAGKCGQFDNAFECQCDNQCPDFGDCCDDYFTLCVDEPECGDGQCVDGEDANSCPEDCQTGLDVLADELSGCLGQSCAEAAVACLGDDACAAAALCQSECEGVQFCAIQCWKEASLEAQALLEPVLACGVETGCIVIDGLPVCGDGECEPGEISPWCAGECNGGGGCDGLCGEFHGALAAVENCLEGGCGAEVAPCAANDDCAALGQCVATCEGIQACAVSCYLDAPKAAVGLFDPVLACGAVVGCFSTGGPVCGDGECVAGETEESCPEDCVVPEPASCEGICFVEYEAGAECQCDPFCLNYDDCCGDYSELCLPPCGNGTCDEDESPITCALDCAPGWECLQDACNTSLCSMVPACAGTLPCLEECADAPCADVCAEPLGGIAAAQFQAIVSCGEDSGCLTVPEICGNGVCEEEIGEDATSCAGDCAVFNPLCLPQECNLNGCFGADGCNALLPCAANCATLECAEACVGAPLDGDDATEWDGVLECATEAGCFQ